VGRPNLNPCGTQRHKDPEPRLSPGDPIPCLHVYGAQKMETGDSGALVSPPKGSGISTRGRAECPGLKAFSVPTDLQSYLALDWPGTLAFGFHVFARKQLSGVFSGENGFGQMDFYFIAWQ